MTPQIKNINNPVLQNLAEKAQHTHTGDFGMTVYGGVDLEAYADLIIRECVNQCDLIDAAYTKLRLGTDDFTDKNRFAEGQLAVYHVKASIAATFWSTPE
jgi:hypothetical protein